MESHNRNHEVKTSKFALLTALLGTLTASVFIATLYIGDKKWIVAVISGLTAAFASLALIGKLKKLIFLSAIFALSIRLDVFIYRKETDYTQLHGLPITLFDILFLFLLLEWLLRIVKKQCIVKFYPGLSIPTLIAIVFCGISVAISNDVSLSFCAFLLNIKSYMIFLYFANNLEDQRGSQGILWIIMAGIMFQSLVGMLQYAAGSTLGLEMLGESDKSFRQHLEGTFILSRVGGTIGSPNGLAMYFNLFLPVLFCTVFMRINYWVKFCSLITLIAGGITELLTFSRGGWIALAGALFIASYVIFKHRFKSRIKSIAFVMIFGVILGMFVIGFSSDARKRLFEDDYKSAYSRIPMMQVAYNMIKDNPFLGVGINSYTSEMTRYDHTRENISYKFQYPVHNTFFLLTAECGLFALLAVLFLIFNIFYTSITSFRCDGRFYALIGVGFSCGVLACVIQGQFEPLSILRTNVLWFNIAMIAAISTKLKDKRVRHV